MLRRKLLSLATALGFLGSSGLALAQDATQPPPAAPPAAAPQSAVVGEAPAAAPAAKEEEKTEEIVVTGTRIRRKDLTTPAPVSIVNRDALQNSGKVSIGDFLQSLPEQGNALNTQVNNGNDGSVNVSLRSLGAQRTLVLVNGRRMVAGGTGADGVPDLNSIPAAAIERIEILKDGASAVYGSDAVAGVVNVILKKKYQGSEASVYGGVTAESDGDTYELSAMTGTGSERGNMLFSVGYQEQKAVFAGDRPWSETTFGWGEWDLDPADPGYTSGKYPTGNSGTFPSGRFTLPGLVRDADGVITGCNAGGTALYQQLCADATGGTQGGFVPTWDGSTTTYELYDGSLYNTNPTNYLITPNRRIQLFATGDSNLGDVARAFFEASYVNRTSAQSLAPMPVTNRVVPTKPIFVDATSIYNPLGFNITTWNKRTVEFGNRAWSQELDTARVVVGLDGSIGDWAGPLRGWSWEAAYNYGRTWGTEVSSGQLRVPNIANAVGPSIDPDGVLGNGDEVCVRSVAGGLTASNIIPGCVPANFLGGEGALSPTAKAYVSYDGTQRSFQQQQIYSLSTAGELFNLPTSERAIGLALGVERRMEDAGNLTDVPTAALESTGNNQLPTEGGYDVTEGYIELSVPLVSGMLGAQDLEVSAALRAFDYSTFGSDTTWKFGARWSPIRDVTIRGTFSTAFRAPTVGELYGGVADSYDFTNGDPCRNAAGVAASAQCSAAQPWGGVAASGSGETNTQFLTKKSPNQQLQPETADIYTAGIVLEPRAIPNLSVTLDYFNIKLDSTIDDRGTQFILQQCYGENDLAMCALINRNPDDNNRILFVVDRTDNLGGTDTSGIDFALRYGIPTRQLGRFNLVFDATYLIAYDQTDTTGFVTEAAGSYDNQLALPKFKANTSLLWAKGGLGAGLSVRYIGSYDECASGVCSADDSLKRTVDSYMPLDLFVAYALKSTAGTTSVSVGIQNVLDTDPPYIYNAGSANSDPSTYDYLGRYFYARIAQAF